MAVQICLPRKTAVVTEPVRFGNFLAGHLQIMQTMTFFHVLQVNTINCESRSGFVRRKRSAKPTFNRFRRHKVERGLRLSVKRTAIKEQLSHLDLCAIFWTLACCNRRLGSNQ